MEKNCKTSDHKQINSGVLEQHWSLFSCEAVEPEMLPNGWLQSRVHEHNITLLCAACSLFQQVFSSLLFP